MSVNGPGPSPEELRNPWDDEPRDAWPGEATSPDGTDATPAEPRDPAATARARRQARRSVAGIVLAQLGVALIAGAVAWMLAGPVAAASALAGGAICALSGAAMALRALRPAVDAEPRALMRAFYVGEATKIMVTVAGFWLVIRYLEVNWLALLLTYIASLSVYWFALATTRFTSYDGSPVNSGRTI